MQRCYDYTRTNDDVWDSVIFNVFFSFKFFYRFPISSELAISTILNEYNNPLKAFFRLSKARLT